MSTIAHSTIDIFAKISTPTLMNQDSPQSYYSNRIEELTLISLAIARKANLYSWIRVLSFVFFMSSLVWLANEREIQSMLILILFFVPIFGVIVTVHNRAKFDLLQQKSLITINQNEIRRLEGDLSSGDNGSEYQEENHAYGPDLDVFGPNSIFQLLVRSKLSGTTGVLKEWMLGAAKKETIVQRQEAIKELSVNTEWRQNLTAYGHHGSSKEGQKENDITSIVNFLDENLNIVDQVFWKMAGKKPDLQYLNFHPKN